LCPDRARPVTRLRGLGLPPPSARVKNYRMTDAVRSWLVPALAIAPLTVTAPALGAAADSPVTNRAALPSVTLLRPARVWTAGEPVHEGWWVLIRAHGSLRWVLRARRARKRARG